jgi:hypothetical protein
LLKQRMSGRDYPHVRSVPGSNAPNPPDFVPVESAQQLGLRFGRQITNLVEKQAAPFRFGERAFPADVRTGESTPFMPEKLALHELAWQSRNVDRDEGSSTPRTLGMKCAGYELLSSAAFTGDKDRQCVPCEPTHLVGQSPHGSARARDSLERRAWNIGWLPNVNLQEDERGSPDGHGGARLSPGFSNAGAANVSAVLRSQVFDGNGSTHGRQGAVSRAHRRVSNDQVRRLRRSRHRSVAGQRDTPRARLVLYFDHPPGIPLRLRDLQCADRLARLFDRRWH